MVSTTQSTARGDTHGSTDSIVSAIIDDLRNGHLVPGQRLVETQLIERHNVGRGTVREAIRRLSGEGLVSLHRFRGASIRLLSDKEMLDILMVLEVLLGLAAKQAAAAIDHSDNRQRLSAALRDLLAHEDSGDFFAAVRLRETFMDTIVEMSGNGELDRVLPKLQLLIACVQMPAIMPEKQRYADYRWIGEAILAGEGDLAEFAARLHMQHAIKAFGAALASRSD